ncbi:hypothetical protein [Paenibacillus spongiae]|uniref:Uncharacterized protein n=1 Tax=Paenibacillus spongiae TaxID=2909671 RepID=A0ABY5SFP6_9BACL|nr:hypothetical protein [Paenibacillus spongiae]UVI32761.1 hypothetical protein L1F29_13430 [Paenibacillus spongiae]
MNKLFEYMYLNLWLLLLWATLVTHQGVVQPAIGSVIAYFAIIGLIKMPRIKQYMLNENKGQEESDSNSA